MPNPNYTHTITLYNCMSAADSPDKKDHWYRHVLQDCYYKAAVTRVESGTSAKMQNVYTVRIPESQNYKPYREWCGLAEEDRKTCFTLHLDDIVVAGECLEEITGASGQSAVQVMNRYKPDAFKATAVSDNSKAFMARHYRIGG